MRMRRGLAILLVLVMAMSLIPTAAMAAETNDFLLSCEDVDGAEQTQEVNADELQAALDEIEGAVDLGEEGPEIRITLQKDTAIPNLLFSSAECGYIIDVQNYTLTLSSGSITTNTGSDTGTELVLMGSGSIIGDGKNPVLLVSDQTLVSFGDTDSNLTLINSGTCSAIKTENAASVVEINGGTIKSDGPAFEAAETNDITINGGKFVKTDDTPLDVNEYLDDSLKQDEQGSIVPDPNAGNYEARIGGKKYLTLANAVTAANAADSDTTIELMKSVTLSRDLGIGNSHTITVDLDWCEIDAGTHQVYTQGNGTTVIRSAGGKIKNQNTSNTPSAAALQVYSGSHVVLSGVDIEGNYGVYAYGDLTIESANIQSKNCGIAVNGSAQVTIGKEGYDFNDDYIVVTSEANCISTQAAQGVADMAVTIYGGTFASTTTNQWNAGPVYWASHGTLDIYGGVFTGQKSEMAALYQKNGTVKIHGGSFEAKDGIKLGAEATDTTEITLDIDGGTFTGTRSGLYFKTDAAGSNCKKFDITLSGGIFTGEQKGPIYSALKSGGAIPNFLISGGTYSADIEPEYQGNIVEGYVSVRNSDGAFTVKRLTDAAVAKIENQYYVTLGEAIAAAQNGDTVKLLTDIQLTEAVTVDKNVIFDLDGKTLTGGASAYVLATMANVEIKNGKIVGYTGIKATAGTLTLTDVDVESQERTIACYDAATVTVDADSTVMSKNDGPAIVVWGDAAAGKKPTLNVEGTVTAGHNFAIAGNGNDTSGTTINISGNANITSTAATAIYHPQAGNLTVSDKATISGLQGIQMCAGTLEVSGTPTIRATGTDRTADKTGDGEIPDGAAISAVSRNYPGDVPTVTISGNPTIVATEKDSVKAYIWKENKEENWTDAKDSVQISGGHYSSSVVEYVVSAMNAELKSASDKATPYSYYKDVAAAQEAAQSGDTIKDLSVTQEDGKTYYTVTLDYADRESAQVVYTIESSGSYAVLENPTRSGYTFLYWKDASGKTYKAGETITVTGNVVLTAQWSSNSGSSGGSHSSSSDYSVTVDSGKHGTVTVSPKNARKGETVTITVKPDKGYELDELTVTTKSGKTVKLTEGKNGKFTFKMPDSKVTVEAAFTRIVETPRFIDVPDGYWAEEAIEWAAENGYMKGNTAETFNPGGKVTRQQLWMILARLSGQRPDDFVEARAWAVGNGVSDGTNPGSAVSRQQLVTILYRYAVMMGYDVSVGEDTNILSFNDFRQVSEYAVPAMQWAAGAGIITGTTEGNIMPLASTTRAQFATILMRFCENVIG